MFVKERDPLMLRSFLTYLFVFVNLTLHLPAGTYIDLHTHAGSI